MLAALPRYAVSAVRTAATAPEAWPAQSQPRTKLPNCNLEPLGCDRRYARSCVQLALRGEQPTDLRGIFEAPLLTVTIADETADETGHING
jgi:hypothetical protein